MAVARLLWRRGHGFAQGGEAGLRPRHNAQQHAAPGRAEPAHASQNCTRPHQYTAYTGLAAKHAAIRANLLLTRRHAHALTTRPNADTAPPACKKNRVFWNPPPRSARVLIAYVAYHHARIAGIIPAGTVSRLRASCASAPRCIQRQPDALRARWRTIDLFGLADSRITCG